MSNTPGNSGNTSHHKASVTSIHASGLTGQTQGKVDNILDNEFDFVTVSPDYIQDLQDQIGLLEDQLEQEKQHTSDLGSSRHLTIVASKEKRINELKNQLIHLKKMYEDLQQDHQTLTEDHLELLELIKNSVSVEHYRQLEERFNSLLESYDQLSSKPEKKVQEISPLTLELQKAQQDYSHLAEEYNKLTTQLRNTRRKLDNKLAEEIENNPFYQKRIDQLNQQHQLRISKLKQILGTLKKQKTKSEQQSDTLNKTLVQNAELLSLNEELQSQNRLLKAQNTQLEEQNHEVSQKLEDIKYNVEISDKTQQILQTHASGLKYAFIGFEALFSIKLATKKGLSGAEVEHRLLIQKMVERKYSQINESDSYILCDIFNEVSRNTQDLEFLEKFKLPELNRKAKETFESVASMA